MAVDPPPPPNPPPGGTQISALVTLVLLVVTIVFFIGGQYLRFVILIGGYSRVILPIVNRYKGVRCPLPACDVACQPPSLPQHIAATLKRPARSTFGASA